LSIKTNIYLIISIIFAMFLIGCTNKAPKEFNLNQLTRVDVEVVKEDGNYGEAEMITETIDVLRKTFKQIKWEPNVEPKMG
jgi:PBP1b-binding outer membrane lipoprotein LpoB